MAKQFKILPVSRLDSAIRLFSRHFEHQYRTRLVSGGQEPMYITARSPSDFHQIVFTRDYLSSALHEVAHWCVAGEERRKMDDYGYWYAPDGRSNIQQQAFERVEVRPQSIERIFAYALGHGFRVSADNLDLDNRPSDEFVCAIQAQTIRYCEEGLPLRARCFAYALAAYVGGSDPLCSSKYMIEDLYCGMR